MCLTGKDHFIEFCKHSGMLNTKFNSSSAAQESLLLFMKPEVSLTPLQEPATPLSILSQVDKVHILNRFFANQFLILIPSTPRS
jgi:hypothetical protein